MSLSEIAKKSILEIGVGNGFMSRYLRGAGLNVTTCDINQSLAPDYLADVRHLPFSPSSFDVVLYYEVLEHLPRKDTLSALGELRRVGRGDAIISLPYSGLCISAYIKRPLWSGFNFRVPIPVYRPNWLISKLKLQHHWALGEYRRSPAEVTRMMADIGFQVVKQEIPMLNNHHQFWVLRVSSGSD